MKRILLGLSVLGLGLDFPAAGQSLVREVRAAVAREDFDAARRALEQERGAGPPPPAVAGGLQLAGARAPQREAL